MAILLDSFNPLFNERRSRSTWPEAFSTMRILDLVKLFPRITMPLSPANLLDSSGTDSLLSYAFPIRFFLVWMKPRSNCRNKIARKPMCISFAKPSNFQVIETVQLERVCGIALYMTSANCRIVSDSDVVSLTGARGLGSVCFSCSLWVDFMYVMLCRKSCTFDRFEISGLKRNCEYSWNTIDNKFNKLEDKTNCVVHYNLKI